MRNNRDRCAGNRVPEAKGYGTLLDGACKGTHPLSDEAHGYKCVDTTVSEIIILTSIP